MLESGILICKEPQGKVDFSYHQGSHIVTLNDAVYFQSRFLACGLGVRKYTVRQFVKACSGKEIIKPLMDSPLIIDARQFTEEEINEMCSRAVYLEACVIMNGTPFNSLRCPHLRQMASCKPGEYFRAPPTRISLIMLLISVKVDYIRAFP